MKFRKLAAAAAIAVGAIGSAHATNVALELALVIDISGSVDSTEYTLQRDGYKAAFQNAGIGSAIDSFAGSGGIAVGVYFFSAGVLRMQDWTQLTSAAQASAFGATIGSLARPASSVDTNIDPTTGAVGAANSGPLVGNGTNVAGGLNAAAWGLANNAFIGARRVIDISGDGKQNRTNTTGAEASCGTEDSAACNLIIDTAQAALASDIVVNGLAIEGAYVAGGLTTWYNAHVKNGGFVETANDFNDFERAVVSKIGREITGNVPEPTSLALVGLALFGLGMSARRKA